MNWKSASLYFILISLFMIVLSELTKGDKKLYPPPNNSPYQTIYLISHGWHTGIAMKTTEIDESLWPEAKEFFPYTYVEVGWGDSGFYRAKEITIELALKALFWPTPSVLHLAAFDLPPQYRFPSSEVIKISVSEQGFRQLLRKISNTYSKDSQKNIYSIGPGIYGKYSRFYQAKGIYHILRTCNVWTAEAMIETGFPLRSWYALTASSVMWQAR